MSFLSRDKHYKATVIIKPQSSFFYSLKIFLIKFVIKVILNPENLKRENFGETHLRKV